MSLFYDLKAYDEVLGTLTAEQIVRVLEESKNCSLCHSQHLYHEWHAGYDFNNRPKVGRGPCQHIAAMLAKSKTVQEQYEKWKAEQP